MSNLLGAMNRRKMLNYTSALSLSAIPLVSTGSNTANAIDSDKSKTMRIQKLDWAGIRIEVDKTTLFVDATSYEQQGDRKLSSETEFKHAVITHHHPDHFDPAALLTVFDKRSRLFCHEATVPWIDVREMRVQNAKLFQPVDVSRWMGSFVAIPVPAVDGFGHPQVSWVIKGGGKTIIHCGDTLWHGYWRDIGNAYGPFDLAFLPINGARINQGDVKDTGMAAVLLPEQAVVAGQLLKAKRICPIHYGRPGENYFEAPNAEAAFLKSARERGVETVVLKSGEFINWD
jgi:L-ascorbate metabolism protein UlaG (beta-lactamase superfamily)